MQEFKEDLFFKKYGRLIERRSTSSNDTDMICGYVELQTQKVVNSKDFFINVSEFLRLNKTFENLESTIAIESALREISLIDQQSVLVIWQYPDDIDKFDLGYLIKYWEDIWFGVSDEAACLFFPESLDMILISHHNCIYFDKDDTSIDVKKAQLKIWLSKTPEERLHQMQKNREGLASLMSELGKIGQKANNLLLYYLTKMGLRYFRSKTAYIGKYYILPGDYLEPLQVGVE